VRTAPGDHVGEAVQFLERLPGRGDLVHGGPELIAEVLELARPPAPPGPRGRVSLRLTDQR
ncbi:hypothetical protein, partial [Nocardia abscessus]|uniref:hypothetical protein n=1 Tax=Nocardia abscessus TaxID=120957 RepID=UPI002453C1D2